MINTLNDLKDNMIALNLMIEKIPDSLDYSKLPLVLNEWIACLDKLMGGTIDSRGPEKTDN